MYLKTIIKNNGSKDSKISIDKFFQFIIVKDLDKNQREITIYNAVVMSAEINKPDVTLSYKYNYQDVKLKDDDTIDCHSFFENEDILKQFWGINSTFTNNTIEKLHEITGEKTPQSVHDYLNSNNPCSGCFYIEQNEKDNIEKSLIKPLKVRTNSNGIVLNDSETKLILPECYRKLILNGFWFKNILTVNIEKNEKNFEFYACIDLLGAKYASPDFKVYLLTDEKYSLKSTRATISYSKKDIDQSNCEVIKVYSQDKMIYFDEWIKLGIKNNSLLRVKMNAASESKIYSEGLEKLYLTIKFENNDKIISREKNLIIFSLFLSLLLSFGFDITRQESDNFKSIFPFYFKSIFSIDALWILICFSIFMKYMYISKTKNNLSLALILFTPLTIWFACYIFLPSIFVSIKFFCWLYYMDIIFGVFLIFFYWRVLYLRGKRKQGMFLKLNTIDKFIGA